MTPAPLAAALQTADLVVLIVYVAAVVGFGCWFVRRSRTTEGFMAADRSLPGWAVGLSIFGTYLSSNTFIGVTGKAYGTNWNQFVFSLSLPIAAIIAVKWFVPFFRKTGEISAYHHLEKRFGLWARTYAVVCYLLLQVSRMGAILFGVALAMRALTGWPMAEIIIATGVLVTFYTLLGGIEAVIWTDVVQSILLTVGALVAACIVLFDMPGGPGQLFRIAAADGKFSLGSFSPSLTESTFWIVLIYGLTMNLKNFGIDQSFVQRYHTARSDKAAARSVWLGALLYIPISALFFFIGTGLYAYYKTQPEMLSEVRTQVAEGKLADKDKEDSMSAEEYKSELADEADKLKTADIQDKVFPHFIVRKLPVGLTGLLIAAIFAAAMSSIDTSLNSSATIILSDIYKRYWRPGASEKESMRVLHAATLLWGAVGTGVAVAMIGVKSVLDTWWKMSGTFAGGMTGLFLLGLLARRVRSTAAAVGAVAGLLVILWMSLSLVTAAALLGVCVLWLGLRRVHRVLAGWTALVGVLAVLWAHVAWLPESWLNFAKSPFHTFLTSVLGTATILLAGWVVGVLRNETPSKLGR